MPKCPQTRATLQKIVGCCCSFLLKWFNSNHIFSYDGYCLDCFFIDSNKLQIWKPNHFSSYCKFLLNLVTVKREKMGNKSESLSQICFIFPYFLSLKDFWQRQRQQLLHMFLQSSACIWSLKSYKGFPLPHPHPTSKLDVFVPPLKSKIKKEIFWINIVFKEKEKC